MQKYISKIHVVLLSIVLHLNGLAVYLSACHMCAWCLQRREENVGYPGTEAANGKEWQI